MATAKPRKTKRTSPPSGDGVELGRIERLDRLVQILERSSLAELSYEDADIAVTLRRASASPTAVPRASIEVPAAPTPTPAKPTPAAPAAVEGGHVIRSPFVGTFYRSPSPEAASFVEVGQRITKGQTLCIVEAMKLMNEIESDVDGVVEEVLATNAQAVQYGDALFRIRTGA